VQPLLHPTDLLSAWAAATPGAESLFTIGDARAFAALAQAYGFDCDSYYGECRLGGPRQLDLLLAFNHGAATVKHPVQRLKALAGVAGCSTQETWRTAASFVERWGDPEDPLHNAVGTIWLEFDDVNRAVSLNAPSVSGCVIRGYGPHFSPGEAEHGNAVDALSLACGAVYADAEAAAWKRRIGDVVKALPSGGRFIHLSWMGARRSRPLKLYGVMPRCEFLDYLERIGFAGHMGCVRMVLSEVATSQHCGRDIYFDLNLSTLRDATTAALGIAFSQQHIQAVAKDDPSRIRLLRRLVADGQCSSTQAHALGEWTSAADRRWLDLKMVIDSRGNVETKAYLGFAPSRSASFALTGSG
jgi:hypothetical protein